MTILVHRSLSDLPSFTFFTGLKLWAIPRTDTDAIREWSSKFDVDEYVKVIPPEKWPDFIMSLKPEKVRIVNEEHDVIYTVITLNSTAFIPHYYGIAIIPKDDDEYSPNWRGAVLKVEPGFYVWQSIDH